MTCDNLESCRFFQDQMKDLPKTTEYLMTKFCKSNYESCNRYQLFKEMGPDNVPSDLVPQTGARPQFRFQRLE